MASWVLENLDKAKCKILGISSENYKKGAA